MINENIDLAKGIFCLFYLEKNLDNNRHNKLIEPDAIQLNQNRRKIRHLRIYLEFKLLTLLLFVNEAITPRA